MSFAGAECQIGNSTTFRSSPEMPWPAVLVVAEFLADAVGHAWTRKTIPGRPPKPGARSPGFVPPGDELMEILYWSLKSVGPPSARSDKPSFRSTKPCKSSPPNQSSGSEPNTVTAPQNVQSRVKNVFKKIL